MTSKPIRHEGYYLDPQSVIEIHKGSTAPEGSNPYKALTRHISLNELRISHRLHRQVRIVRHGLCLSSLIPDDANVLVVMQKIDEQFRVGNYLAEVNDLYCCKGIRSFLEKDAIVEYFCLVFEV